MPKQNTDELKARSEQSSESKRATFDKLMNKPRAQRVVTLSVPQADGAVEEITLLFRAIGSAEYDRLQEKCPPTVAQKADNLSYNLDKFGPLLLSRVCVEPDMSAEEWNQLWNSEDWNRGEIGQLFLAAVELCNKGLDIPFTDNA